TRKVAWKASSASWVSPSTRRQTPQTIAPWRSTRAAKAVSAAVAASADSARLAVYRSRSSLSVSPVAVPAVNRARNDRNGEPGCPFPMVVRLAVVFGAVVTTMQEVPLTDLIFSEIGAASHGYLTRRSPVVRRGP